MTKEQRAKIQTLVEQFRLAIERAKASLDPRIPWLDRFPKDCCDHTAQLLSFFLYQHGVEGFLNLSAEVPHQTIPSSPLTHVWLQVGDLTIDITADQFDSVSDPVLVCEHSPFHESLVNRRQRTVGSRDEDEQSYFRRVSLHFVFAEWYRAVLEYV